MNEVWKALSKLLDGPQEEPSAPVTGHQLTCVKIGILLGRGTKINPELLNALSGEGAGAVEYWLSENGVTANQGDDPNKIYEDLRTALENQK